MPPPDAIVTPVQAESALGKVQATGHDTDIFETLDEDQKEEEMALMGRVVNPRLVDYDGIAWSPVSDSDDGLASRCGAQGFDCNRLRVYGARGTRNHGREFDGPAAAVR